MSGQREIYLLPQTANEIDSLYVGIDFLTSIPLLLLPIDLTRRQEVLKFDFSGGISVFHSSNLKWVFLRLKLQLVILASEVKTLTTTWSVTLFKK